MYKIFGCVRICAMKKEKEMLVICKIYFLPVLREEEYGWIVYGPVVNKTIFVSFNGEILRLN